MRSKAYLQEKVAVRRLIFHGLNGGWIDKLPASADPEMFTKCKTFTMIDYCPWKAIC